MKSYPTLDAGPFRAFPTRAARQRFQNSAAACGHCLGGSCCQSEDAIYLTAFDVLRLSAFLDLSPADFLNRFTQESFAEGPLEPYRRQTIDDPDSSVVTYLRRRSNRSYSPCIFLKYVRDPDGTPRRICGVHPARPLACREYYQNHCKTRATGELAALQAHAFEMIRDGKVTLRVAEAERQRLRPLLAADAPMSAWLEYATWTEAWRALQMDETNEEGVNSYRVAEYQDPIDEKLNRLLSKQRLRLEERYGWVPHGEQLQAFRDGFSFAASPDRDRLLRIVGTPPARGLFEDGDYPFFAANRLTVTWMRPPGRFPLVDWVGRRRLLDAAPAYPVFPGHRSRSVRDTTSWEVWNAVLNAADALVTFAGYLATMGEVLEAEPPGTLEWELLCILRRLEVDGHPVVAVHPGLRAVADWARSVSRPNARMRRFLRDLPPTARASPPAVIRRLIDTQRPDGTWASDPAARQLPDSQAEYLRIWLHTTGRGLLQLRPPPLSRPENGLPAPCPRGVVRPVRVRWPRR
jgi:Fe-S-cluster containining protein